MADELMDYAQAAIDLGDGSMAAQALRRAQVPPVRDDVIHLLSKSGLVLKESARLSRSARARTEAEERGFQIQTVGEFGYLDTVEYLCPVGHSFATKPKSFQRASQPCPVCKEGSEIRAQINVRLSVEHTKKYLDVVSYFKGQEGIGFLGEKLSSTDLVANSTALGRFLLETAIDDLYLELQDFEIIDTMAGWILEVDVSEGCQIKTIEAFPEYTLKLMDQSRDEWRRHSEDIQNSIEDYSQLCFVRAECFELAVSRWGKDLGSIYHKRFFPEAVMTALKSLDSSTVRGGEGEIDLERRMKRWNRNG